MAEKSTNITTQTECNYFNSAEHDVHTDLLLSKMRNNNIFDTQLLLNFFLGLLVASIDAVSIKITGDIKHVSSHLVLHCQRHKHLRQSARHHN